MNAHRIDIDVYLGRIGYKGVVRPTLDLLRELQRLHLQRIPFETLGSLLQEPVSLDLSMLEHKVLRNHRGGHCFELNLLFLRLLQELGFAVRGLTGRVLMNGSGETEAPRTHMLLLVNVDDVRYLVDVGFGMAPTGPLRLDSAEQQATPHESYMLTKKSGSYMLSMLSGESWRPLYQFDLATMADIDYEVANWYVVTHPESSLRRKLLVARAEPGLRRTFHNGEYTIRRLSGPRESRTIDDPIEAVELLRTGFDLNVPHHPAIVRALGEVLRPQPGLDRQKTGSRLFARDVAK